MTLNVYLSGIGIFGPGLESWERSRTILAGHAPYVAHDSRLPQPTLLPAMERRRASATVRLGTHVAQEALEQSGMSAVDLATVFASADGDTEILDNLCATLAGPEKAVSPTRFHNSVHNAAAGYWTIATGSHAPSNSLGCYDGSFAGALLDAACQATVEQRPMLVSVYDIAAPEPLHQVRPVSAPFGVALALDIRGCENTTAQLCIDLDEQRDGDETVMTYPALEILRKDNPAARALPLLAAIAREQPAQVVLKYVAGNSVHVQIRPWS